MDKSLRNAGIKFRLENMMLVEDFEVIDVIENEIEERVKALASYIIETGSTVRAAASKFNVSKSTVHKDISERLEKINPALWKEAKQVLEHNKEERHIRGGMATKIKYESRKA